MFRKAILGLTAAAGLTASASAQSMIWNPATGQWVANSATRIDNVDPWGRVNTSGTTLHSSATDPYRDASRFNGTMRNVNRPKFDAYGNIIGYEVGVEWNNSVTGRVHGDTRVVTNNGLNVATSYPTFPTYPSGPTYYPPMGGGLNVQSNVYSGGGFGPPTGFNFQGPNFGAPGGSNVQNVHKSMGGRHVEFNTYRNAPNGTTGGGRPGSGPRPR